MLTRTVRAVVIFMLCVNPAIANKAHSTNVGTVLFSRSDINKTRWTKSQISLLRARQYFQKVLPPLECINPLNDDYVKELLSYLENTFNTINKVAKDPHTNALLNAAFSDTIGGYLQMWLLPIVKLGFYSGIISQDNAVDLMKLYNDIKSNIKTDGEGWHEPNTRLLTTIPINVPTPRHVPRSITKPCENLMYFTETARGFSIPTPSVNWDPKVNAMFLPIKFSPIISMNSTNSSDALVNFYDSAKQCLLMVYPEEVAKFDDDFQCWLLTDVTPHLKNINLYIPFKSVLSMFNKTDNFGDSLMHLYSNSTQKHCNYIHRAEYFFIAVCSSMFCASGAAICILLLLCCFLYHLYYKRTHCIDKKSNPEKDGTRQTKHQKSQFHGFMSEHLSFQSTSVNAEIISTNTTNPKETGPVDDLKNHTNENEMADKNTSSTSAANSINLNDKFIYNYTPDTESFTSTEYKKYADKRDTNRNIDNHNDLTVEVKDGQRSKHKLISTNNKGNQEGSKQSTGRKNVLLTLNKSQSNYCLFDVTKKTKEIKNVTQGKQVPKVSITNASDILASSALKLIVNQVKKKTQVYNHTKVRNSDL